VVGEYVWSDPPPRRRERCIGPGHLAVIPWRAVRIGQEGAAPFVADPGTVVFYNAGQPYFAEQLDPRGEHSIYFRIDPDDFAKMVRSVDARAHDRGNDRPLRLTHGRCDVREFERHRRLLAYARCPRADPLRVDEEVITLVEDLLAAAHRGAGCAQERTARTLTQRRRRDAAEAARLFILRRFREPLGLRDIADAAGVSAAHLCRIFRLYVGQPVHQYLTEIRLRASFEPLCDSDVPLAALALDLGFSNQAHFTSAFSTRFGCSPGAMRGAVRTNASLPSSTILKDRPRPVV
jgi:AraC-like DNA-binding protein